MADLCFDGIRPYERPTQCSGGATKGAKALLAHFLESVPSGRNLGIYNCRTVRGSSLLSTHAEGRAVDPGVPMTLEGRRAMDWYLTQLAPHAGRIGLCYVIWYRTVYNTGNPCGRPYGGSNPHIDHAHIELTRLAARNLTLTTLRTVVGDFRDPDNRPPDLGDDEMETTKGIQKVLRANLYLGANGKPLTIDGIWGPNTEHAFGNMVADAKGGGTGAHRHSVTVDPGPVTAWTGPPA